jgi:hypothetical protein
MVHSTTRQNRRSVLRHIGGFTNWLRWTFHGQGQSPGWTAIGTIYLLLATRVFFMDGTSLNLYHGHFRHGRLALLTEPIRFPFVIFLREKI